MDKNTNKITGKIKEHKKDILKGAGIACGMAASFALGAVFVKKNNVTFKFDTKEYMDLYRQFFECKEAVKGVGVGKYLGKEEILKNVSEFLDEKPGDYTYGVIVERYSKKD